MSALNLSLKLRGAALTHHVGWEVKAGRKGEGGGVRGGRGRESVRASRLRLAGESRF